MIIPQLFLEVCVMEETLGKRIMRHRKQLNLTQDQLAEQLGVTAQAVSKWENDLSCPDIAMLPKLSRIFGITTDQLLGTAPEHVEAPVFQGEVVEETDNAGNVGWEFHWDGSRKGHMTFAALVLALGVQLLLSKLLAVDISFWQILWPSTLIIFGLGGFFGSFSFIKVSSILLGSWFLADYWDVLPFQFGSDLIFPALVIIFGLSLLLDAFRKPRKSGFHFHRKGGNKRDYHIDGDCFVYDVSFSESCQMVEMPILSKGHISCNFGDYIVDLTHVDAVAPGCTMEVNCSFGDLVLRIPRRFAIRQSNTTAFASFEISGHPDAEPAGIIDMTANVSFGEIEIEYV